MLTYQTTYQIWISRFNIGLLLILLSALLPAQAHENHHHLLAMGDLSAIKTDFIPNSGAVKMSEQQPSWDQLSDEQKKILSALGGEWDTLRPWQREKMLDIARDYPNMDAQKQLRIQRRLIAWSRMTPYERENARKRYQHFQQLSPEKKDELRQKWTEHKKSKADSGETYDAVFDGAE